MSKKFWMKGALLLLTGGTMLQFGGCWTTHIQRILTAVTID